MSSSRWSAPSGGDPAAGARRARRPQPRGGSERGVRPRRPAGRRRGAVRARAQRSIVAVSLRARAVTGALVPRGRGLRAGGLPLAPLLPAAALAHRRREHRPLGGQAVPHLLREGRRSRRLDDPGRRDRAPRARLAGHLEAALHACGGMRVALVGVLARLERDLPRLVSDEGDRRCLVHAFADQMEVVARGLVLDVDRVGARLERLHVLAVLLALDREAGANFTDETGRLRRCRRWDDRHREGDERDEGDASRCHTQGYAAGALPVLATVVTSYCSSSSAATRSSKSSRGCGRWWNVTDILSMRLPSTSRTSNCRPFQEMVSPGSGARPSCPKTKPPTVWKSSSGRSVPKRPLSSSIGNIPSSRYVSSSICSICTSATSNSSSISPTISSIRSSSVQMPAIAPYSSTTTAKWLFVLRNSCSSVARSFVSGT